MNTRARFEEIWPVPDGLFWDDEKCRYWTPLYPMCDSLFEWNHRLDTFTHCQETTDVCVSLIDELVADIRYRAYHEADDDDDEKSKGLLHRVNQIMERKK